MPATPPPRIICFDLGGVVVRICRSWGEACRRAGLPERQPERFGAPELAATRRHAVELYQTGQMGCEAFWHAISSASAGLYSPDDVRRIHNSWVIEDYPGVAGLVRDLNRCPVVTTACLSNTNHAHWQGMLGLGEGHSSPAVRAIAHHGVSHLLGASKPGDRIYRLAEQSMRAAPAEILFFDDLAENIEAARRLGWRAHHIDHERETAPQILESCRAHGVPI